MPAAASPPAARERVRRLACEAFEHAGCEGLARVDFFVDGEGCCVNELNTMPGFTPTSVYAKLLEASGIAYPELLDSLCRLALERRARRGAALPLLSRRPAEQRELGDRRRLHARRQRRHPQQVVAVARAARVELDARAVPDVGVWPRPGRASPAR